MNSVYPLLKTKGIGHRYKRVETCCGHNNVSNDVKASTLGPNRPLAARRNAAQFGGQNNRFQF
jgi:hypothetical protein